MLKYGCFISLRSEIQPSGRIIIGKKTRISSYVVLKVNGGILKIGDNCTINSFCFMLAGKKGIDIGNDKMVLYRKYTVGDGWDAGYTNISNTTGNGSYATMDPCAVTDIAGDIHLVWKDSQSGNREIYYKKCIDGVWDDDFINISNTAGASAHPSISTDNQGNLYVFWAEKIGGVYYEIVYKKYDKILLLGEIEEMEEAKEEKVETS